MNRQILILCLALAACAGCAGNREYLKLRERVSTLEADRKKQDRRMAALDSTNRVQGLQLKELQARLKLAGRASSEDITVPQPPEPDLDGARVDSLPVGPAYPDQPRKARTAASATRTDKLYQSGCREYKAGRYGSAEATFRELVKLHPKDKLADDALFWIGQGYYLRKRYREALAAYQAIVARYPKGDKAPAAAYKAGLCHLDLKEKEQAREVWRDLIQKHPRSPEAKTARKRLKPL